MMQNTLSMLLGAALVAIGVLAAALADRIRGHRAAQETAPRERERTSRASSIPTPARGAIPVVEAADLVRPTAPKSPRPARPEPKPAPTGEGGDDVIVALVSAGYKKPIATEATWECSAAERATVEGWTAAALRRCARGGLS